MKLIPKEKLNDSELVILKNLDKNEYLIEYIDSFEINLNSDEFMPNTTKLFNCIIIEYCHVSIVFQFRTEQ